MDGDALAVRETQVTRPVAEVAHVHRPDETGLGRLESSIRLDRTSPVPLYFQIAVGIKDAIERGAFKAGQLLDTELRLADRLGVSRPTVRQAIQQLAQQGIVVRQRGVGTLVVTQRIERPVALTSLYDDLVASGCTPATTVLEIRELPANLDVATALSLTPEEPVLLVERLRLTDNAPLAVMRNYLPISLLAHDRLEAALEHSGLYDLLRRQGVEFHSADQVIGARKPTSREARLLETSRNGTVLTMTRTAFDRTGRPIEHGRHVYLAEQYSFTMKFVVP